jgi:hypothetical protein
MPSRDEKYNKRTTNLVSFVTKEVNFTELVKVSQTVCLVPALRENLLQASRTNNEYDANLPNPPSVCCIQESS